MLMDESFKEASRISANCFTRDRKVSFTDLMVFTLRSSYKSLSVEIDQFFNKLSGTASPPSKQAVSKARMKINHIGFKKIENMIVEEYYCEKYKTYKGYRLLAVDGSIVQLPSSEDIAEHFGKMNKQPDQVNCGRSITVYDVLNDIIVDSKLYPSDSSERVCLAEQITTMQKEGKQRKDIIIADRGFPSLPLLMRLKKANYDFVIRYNGENFLREFSEFAQSRGSDKIVEVSLTAPGRRQDSGELEAYAEDTAIKLRIVKVKLETGELEYLVTSILEKSILTKHDFQKIYGSRWGIEEGFKTLKNTIELENFSSKTVETVLQEYYSKIVIYNLHSTLVQEAQKELDKKKKEDCKEYKYEKYCINQNVSYGLVRDRLIDLFGKDNGNWDETYEYLLEAVQRNPIPVRPDRHYERIRKGNPKFPINRRRAV